MAQAPRKSRAKSPRKKPVQARGRATWEAILEAAARILVRRGYACMTTNHVAAVAGVSIGTLYEYFPNKDALVYALLDEHVAEAERALAYADEGFLEVAMQVPLSRSIERLVSTLISLHANDPGLHRVLFEEASRLKAVRDRAEAIERRMIALVTELVKRHPDADVPDAELAARIVVRTVESLVHGWVTHPASAPAEPAVFQREIVRLVLAYVKR